MPYDSNPDRYIDFETGVLNNLLDITSTEELEEAEADITRQLLLLYLKNLH